ncbi:MAG: hypothetical protein V1927_05630 [Candidatus Omnitrophota bacterium]
MKKLFFILGITALVFAAAFLAFEAGLRAYGLFDKNRGLKNCMGEPNKKYHHAFKPNSRFRLIAPKNDEYNVGIRINNYGLRGADMELKKKPGTKRILAMGDSFTFGVGAEDDETIPYLIGKYLKERGENVEVINAGIGGSSPLSNYMKARDEYLEFEPDLVLYFFDFSDLADDWRGEKSLVYDKNGDILRCDPAYAYGKRDWWAFMRLHSKACSYIHNKLIRLFGKIRILGLRGYIQAKLEGKRAKSLIVAQQADEMNKNPIEYDGYLMIRGPDRIPQVKEHFKRNEKYLNMIRDLFASRGIPMILVIYPYGIHVGPDIWSEGRGYWGFEKGKLYDDYYAFDMLEDYARRNNIPCINLLPDFLKAGDEHLFFDLDGHFTPEANKIAAKAIASKI